MLVMRPSRLLLGGALLVGTAFALLIGSVVLRPQASSPTPSAVVARGDAAAEPADWGTFYTYFSGESYGTTDLLTGVAVIDAGWEIHPPHRHAEEEYLIVTEGRGTWHLNGESFPAEEGDMLYAAPWDVHGITNTGDTPLTFVVWKANGKGVPVPEDPER